MSSVKKPSNITKSLKLQITQEIIDHAVRKDSTSCLIADALKATIPGSSRPLADLQTISVSIPERGLRYHWLTPRSGQKLLLDFDAGASIEPCVVGLHLGWTTPIDKGHARKPQRAADRKKRRAELEDKEARGSLTDIEARSLATMRATDLRDAQPKEPADRTQRTGRPPLGSLSNANTRRYGLRLARLTPHGERLTES